MTDYIRILLTVAGFMVAYHAFVMKKIEEKVSKEVFEMRIKSTEEKNRDVSKVLLERVNKLEDTIKDQTKQILEIFKKDKY